MTRVSNRRRYLRKSDLDGLKRNRLSITQQDFAEHGGAPGTAQNAVTFANLSNIVNYTSHPYALNDGPFVLITTGTLPAELSTGKLYWVAGTVNLNDFQLSEEKGGAVVTFTDDGTGTHTLCEIMEDPI